MIDCQKGKLTLRVTVATNYFNANLSNILLEVF